MQNLYIQGQLHFKLEEHQSPHIRGYTNCLRGEGRHQRGRRTHQGEAEGAENVKLPCGVPRLPGNSEGYNKAFDGNAADASLS